MTRRSDFGTGQKKVAGSQAAMGADKGKGPLQAAKAELQRQHPTVGQTAGKKVDPTKMKDSRNVRNKTIGLLLAGLLGLSGSAQAAGLDTNGLPTMVPGGRYTNLGTRALTAVDTGLPNGQSPQTVAVEMFRIASYSMEMIANQATSTAGTATLNTLGGMVTTEALTTAVGASYTFTLVNSNLVAGGPAPIISIFSKSNTGGLPSAGAAGLQITSVVVTTGQAVITVVNNGTAALNGTMLIGFHV